MTASATSETEMLTEHFGYPPVSLLDDIINSINILAERALNSVEQGLLAAPPATLGFKSTGSSSNSGDASQLSPVERAKAEIESGTHQLETLLCASIDRNFDKFELWVLRNIFSVRPPDLHPYVRLGHYEGLDFSATDDADNDQPSLEGINALRRKLRESMKLNALLHAEQAKNARLLEQLQGVVGGGAVGSEIKREDGGSDANPAEASAFGFLRQRADLTEAGSDAPISTTTAFTLSQLQSLRALSSSLRTLAPDLAASASAAGGADDGQAADDYDGDKSWRRERREYVESATRRHLENIQGLELGKSGEVRDGEWQGEGRTLGQGEAEGLERVVALLDVGGSKEKDKQRGDEEEEGEEEEDTMDES